MADSKISALTELVAPESDDVVPVVDTSATTTKKVMIGKLVNCIPGFATTATAAGTTTLAVASRGIQEFTGATTQIVALPVVSTLPQTGFQYLIINRSSGAVTVNSSGGNLVQSVAANTAALVTCILLTGTGSASWDSLTIGAAGVTANSTVGNIPYLSAANVFSDSNAFREDANTLALKNGTTAQTLSVYNTTDGTNLERGKLFWNSNVLTLFADKAGTGQTRNIQIQGYGDINLNPGNASGFSLTTGGIVSYLDILFLNNNTHDIGRAAMDANPRTGYFATSVVAPLLQSTSDVQVSKTITAGGTVGAQTINKTAGTVNFAAAAASLVVTNSLVTANSIIIATVGTNDVTMKSVQAVAGAGSFTLFANAAATAECRVNFVILN